MGCCGLGNPDAVEGGTNPQNRRGAERGSGSAALAKRGCSDGVAVGIRHHVTCQRAHSQGGEDTLLSPIRILGIIQSPSVAQPHALQLELAAFAGYSTHPPKLST